MGKVIIFRGKNAGKKVSGCTTPFTAVTIFFKIYTTQNCEHSKGCKFQTLPMQSSMTNGQPDGK